MAFVTYMDDPVQGVTSGGEPIVAIVDSDEGDCTYCGEVIYGQTAVTKGGMRLANKPQMWTWERGQFHPWHLNCYERHVIEWTVNANGRVHRSSCSFAEAAAERVTCTRGEARVWSEHRGNGRYDGQFCERCAPLDFWYEPFIGGAS